MPIPIQNVWNSPSTLSKRHRFGIFRVFDPLQRNTQNQFNRFCPIPGTTGNPNTLVSETLERLYSYPVDAGFTDYLKSFLLSGTTDDYYWTSAWNNYISAPNNASYKAIVETRLCETCWNICSLNRNIN